MLWAGRAVLLTWALLVIVQLPLSIRKFQHILSSGAPAAEHNAAILHLAVETIVALVVVPLFLYAVVGYGIAFNPGAWLTGRPWFGIWWRPRQRHKRTTLDR